MDTADKKKMYIDPKYGSYLVQYRGDFLGEISKIDYACGFIITEKIAIISVKDVDYSRISKDIPSILLIEVRTMYVLEDVSPIDTANINFIKQNDYLGLDGKDVLIGIVDTGIDYLNKEFLNEDDTTRIVSIWDQSERDAVDEDVFIGKTYNREQINEAIAMSKSGKDPYSIVPCKDEIGHGTRMSGIIGARGYDEEIQGIANGCEFVVVKLAEDTKFISRLIKNGVKQIPIYDNCDIFAAIDYLSRVRIREKKPMVILVGLGTTENSHDGNGILSRYINEISQYNPLAIVTGTGNEADSEGHVTESLKNIGEKKSVELNIPRVIDSFRFAIWVKKPNKMSINIISPSGEQSREIKSKINQVEEVKFIFEDTYMKVEFFVPQAITGHEAIFIRFDNIKPGIWKFELIGDYIIDGRFDIWLPPKAALPKGTKFLSPNPESTLTIPASAKEAISVAYYDSSNNSMVSNSGRGYNINNLIKPNIAAPGVNILTTDSGGKKTTVSGSCVAAAIVCGICGLLFQWGVVKENDFSMNATKMRGYLINGATRDEGVQYPNTTWGYGKVDLRGIYNAISGTRSINIDEDKYREYYVGGLFVRIPRRFAKREE